MANTWNQKRAAEHIDKKLADVKTVNVVDLTRDTSLEDIPVNKAYRTNGVHIYADILNLDDMLGITGDEGVTCHKRTLRFLNLHYRAVQRVLDCSDAKRVDFHNQRLHAIVLKPYDGVESSEAARIHRSIAVAQLVIDVLAETGDDDEHIPNAQVRVGIDSGEALAVNNGRRGGREPLFLGDPANHAAKISGAARKTGIYLTNKARTAIGLAEAAVPKSTPLTTAEIQASRGEADLDVSKDEIVEEWRDDLDKNPIGAFQFSRHTPPLRTMDVTALTPGNSRRQEAVSVYADIDGFTNFITERIADDAETVVRTFHVLRAELDRVLTCEFDGRRIRFIGDCLHGLLCEGTAHITDESETVSTATLCTGALRSSFELALTKLADEGIDAAELGLAIGFELGPITVTRLGLHGDRVRCSVSRGVLAGEAEQRRCDGTESAIGTIAYDAATDAVRRTFGKERKRAGLDYNEAVEGMADDGDEVAKAAKREAFIAAPPAVARAADRMIRPFARA